MACFGSPSAWDPHMSAGSLAPHVPSSL